MRRSVVPIALACACVVLPGAAFAKRAKQGDALMRIVAPAARGLVAAHPHVNVIVRFTDGSDVGTADPTTFRARVGRTDITSSFTPIIERGRVVGMRAALDRPLLRVGRRRTNRIRLQVWNQVPAGRKGRVRDVDRVRFHAVERDNQAPVAAIIPDTDLVVPELAATFDGGQGSFDPDGDALSFVWDFGDGGTSTEAVATHTFGGEPEAVTVRLTVSDGQVGTQASVTLRTCSPPDGAAPGVLQVSADAGLEFGGVAPGSAASHTLRVANTSDDPTSVMAVCIASSAAQFSTSTPRMELRGGEHGDVTVTFAPTAGGHQHARIGIAATATNRSAVSVLAHGYGGTAPGTGPTTAAIPVFYADAPSADLGAGLGVKGIQPDGSRIAPPSTVRTCRTPQDGAGTGDYCLADADCAANGGTCPTSATCLGGARAGQPCSTQGECPDGSCPAAVAFDPLEMCGDGAGGLYLLSDDGTYTDPSPGLDELGASVLRLSLDGAGTVVDSRIIDRTTSDTMHIACDGFAATAGGRAYLAELHNLPDANDCFRSERESLVAIAKSNGNLQTLLPRIDAQAGVNDCEDLDPTTHLEVSADGAKMFASFESSGLWRIRPTPLQYVDGFSFSEPLFRLHPDDGLVLVTASDGPTTSVVDVHRLTAEQVAQNPIPPSALAPCGSFHIPNNGAPGDPGHATVVGFAVAPKSPSGRDAVVLVTVAASRAGGAVLSPNLAIRATLAFDAPAGSDACPFTGVINLETLDQMTF